MKQVFISYSWKDEAIVLRLYNDLKRQNVNLWLDRIDGEPTGDFKKEFLDLIEECSFFIVIDSSNYRHNSNWCATELNACFNRIDKQQNVTIIVCLAESSGIWRNVDLIEDMHTKRLFDRLNLQKCFKLFHDGIYDNQSNYLNSIESICRILGKETLPWDFFPEKMDMIDELNASMDKISANDMEALTSLLDTIVCRRKNRRDIKSHLEQLISDCNELGVHVFLPEWLYVIWMADRRHEGKYDMKCLKCLESLKHRFPDDSRIYRGLGGINARLDRQEQARDNYIKAYDLLTPDQIEIRYEVLCNLSQIYMNLQSYATARHTIENAMRLMEDIKPNTSLAINYFECLIFLDEKAKAYSFIEQLANSYPIAEFQSSYGCCKIEQGDYKTAIKYLERAHQLKPNLENTYFLLRCLQKIGNFWEYAKIMSSVDSTHPTCEDELFWLNEISKLPRFL